MIDGFASTKYRLPESALNGSVRHRSTSIQHRDAVRTTGQTVINRRQLTAHGINELREKPVTTRLSRNHQPIAAGRRLRPVHDLFPWDAPYQKRDLVSHEHMVNRASRMAVQQIIAVQNEATAANDIREILRRTTARQKPLEIVRLEIGERVHPPMAHADARWVRGVPLPLSTLDTHKLLGIAQARGIALQVSAKLRECATAGESRLVLENIYASSKTLDNPAIGVAHKLAVDRLADYQNNEPYRARRLHRHVSELLATISQLAKAGRLTPVHFDAHLANVAQVIHDPDHVVL